MPVPELRHDRITFVASRSIMTQALGIEFPSMYSGDFEQPIYTFSSGAILYLVKEQTASSHAGNRSIKEYNSRPLGMLPYDITPVDVKISYNNTTLARYNTLHKMTAFNPNIPILLNDGRPILSMPNQCRTDQSWWSTLTTGSGTDAWVWDNVKWVWNYITPTRTGSAVSVFSAVTPLQWVGFRPDLLLITTTRYPGTGQNIRITQIETPLGNVLSGAIGGHTTVNSDTIVYDVPLSPSGHPGIDLDSFTIYHDGSGETPLTIETISFEFTPVAPPSPTDVYKYPNLMMESSLTWSIVGFVTNRSDVKAAFLFLISRIQSISEDVKITFERDNHMTIKSVHQPEPFPTAALLSPPLPNPGS